jgi:OHCU decarboxylase
VDGAAADVLTELAEANRVYQEKFGYIFIVRATGRTAEEMLALLRARLENDPRAEIAIAAGQQAEITALRLDAIS